MEKMAAPILKVIRFQTEDVIVTSSATMLEGLKANTPYFALGSEINEFKPDEDKSKSRFYTFTYDPASNQIRYTSSTAYLEKEIKDNNIDFPNIYAWFTNQWVTENQYKDYYFTKGSWTQ